MTAIWLSGYIGAWNTVRRYVRDFVLSNTIDMFLMVCVFFNTLTLALTGLLDDSTSESLKNLNLFFTTTFLVEFFLKMFGIGPRGYAKDYFNLFDGFVVALSVVELVIDNLSSGGEGGSSSLSAFRAVRIFRTFRVLRVTRLLRSLQFIKVIMNVI